MSVIRVVIADDSQVARDVLRDILSRDDDIEIVGKPLMAAKRWSWPSALRRS
ncbi:hypothetical protein HORIV_60720 [Vreelandella olivaria]|uniref:Response regulatory domain-containing protein n=1 Tax=Vreelandella olivaria TaxID=390919 RepID=A0ABM7GRE8_9GAMM|nr:hypothetical protein HORIV_60720 [Halomonas olivaria]